MNGKETNQGHIQDKFFRIVDGFLAGVDERAEIHRSRFPGVS